MKVVSCPPYLCWVWVLTHTRMEQSIITSVVQHVWGNHRHIGDECRLEVACSTRLIGEGDEKSPGDVVQIERVFQRAG